MLKTELETEKFQYYHKKEYSVQMSYSLNLLTTGGELPKE